MATSNLYQTRTQILDYDSIIDKVSYERILLSLGRVPSDWKASFFEKSQRDVLRLSYSDIQVRNSTISDNVFHKVGIDYQKEEIFITPIILEISESQFRGSNINEVIPMVITEMNQELDVIVNRHLMEISKKGNPYTWACQGEFIDFALDITRIPGASQLRKFLIIPENLYWSMLCGTNNPSHPSWYSALIARMAEVNTSVIVSPFSSHVMLIQENFLMEYSGIEPHVYKTGQDDRKNEYWVHFLMSNSDFKLRKKDAIQSFEIKDMPKLGSKEGRFCATVD